MRRVVPVVIGLLIAASVMPFLPAGPAGAAPAKPVLIAPADGPSVGSVNPVFRWGPAAGAVRYIVQVSTTADMANLISGGSITTTNVQATFTADLPNSTLFWRVRAYETASGGTPVDSDVWSFVKGAISAPANPTPTGTQVAPNEFTFPTQPPTFSWSPVAGAVSYEVTFDNDSNFTPPLTLPAKVTTNTTFTLDTPLTVDQVFFWRVRARGNNTSYSGYSTPQAFKFVWNAKPTLVWPTPSSTATPIEEVRFEWTATPGAVKYLLEYTPNEDFSNPTQVEVKSTRYSPPTTLDNGSYFWQVRGITGFGGTGPVSDRWTFARGWPGGSPTLSTPQQLGAVTLVSPTDNDFFVTEPNFAWTAQRLASRYQLEISTDPNFSPDLIDSCITNHTRLTPKNSCNVDPDPGTLYYWRVKGLDEPEGVNGVYSEVRRFIYFPSIVALTAPANGTSSSAPVLQWDPGSSDLIGRYRVSIWDETDTLVEEVDTFNTYLIPKDLDTAPAKSTHTWTVQTLDSEGREGPLPGLRRSFTIIDPAPLFPNPNPTSPNNASGTRVPPLTWTPVTNADQYTVEYRTQGSPIWLKLVQDYKAHGYAHPLSNILPGVYEWRVIAKDGNTQLSTSTFVQVFQVLPLDASVPNSSRWPVCSLASPCAVRYDTPTMDWEPVIGASHYKVYISPVENFTTLVSGTPYQAQYSQLTPQISLPDNQAGLGYYWYARPCYGTNPEICGPGPDTFVGQPGTPVRAFRKQSKAIPLTSPANGATVGNQITFSWGGFLQTNCPLPASPAPSYRCGDDLDNNNEVTQEARNYRIEVSDKVDFSTLVDSAVVDQLTYTAYNKTYPEGPLYWRVAPIDQSNNILTWSTRQLTKLSPVGALVSPANNASTSTPSFTWTPQAFDAKWEIEVYKNPGVALAPGNRVFTKITEVPAATPIESLPPDTYGWRVRRYDADNRAGAWSNPELPSPGPVGNVNNLRLFTLTGNPFNLSSPGNGATEHDPNRLLFQWQDAPLAASYKFEVNTQQNFLGTKAEPDVTTVMNKWAPRSPYLLGKLWWRVSSLDADGETLYTTPPFSLNSGDPGSKYVSIAPVRVLDSRTGLGWSGRLAAGSPRTLKVAGGSAPAPDGATAVVINVTAIESNSGSFITVWPNGSATPTASNLNFNAGQIIPNLVTVKVGDNGNVDFATAVGNVNVVADMVGYYDNSSGDQFNPLDPARLLDSRDSGTQAYWNPVGSLAQTPRDLQVTGRGGVPADATAAIVNITVTDGNAQSFLMAYPTGSPQPAQASNLNFLPGQIIPNLAIVKIGTGGKIRLFNAQGSVNVIVDVVGYFKPNVGSKFHPLEPNRVLDTRVNNGLSGTFSTNQTRDLQVSNRAGADVDRNVPTGASAVVMNTTAVSGTALSYLTLFPDETEKPLQGSNLNFSPGQIIPNLVTVKMSAAGKVSIYNNSGKVDVVGDVVGYYSIY